MNTLTLSDVSCHFGGVAAVSGLSFSVASGEVLSLIGPNGAGKTTVLNLISGFNQASSGTIRMGNADITSLPVHARAALGLQRTFQNLQIFFNMSALENVMVGFHQHQDTGVLSSLFGLQKIRAQNRVAEERAHALMEQVGLRSWLASDTASMPYGALKRLEIARALAAAPKFLLLDEPAAGLNPSETAAIDELIRSIAASGVAVMLVEHDMKLVMNISQRILVLNYGKQLATGTPAEIRANPRVIEAYLGVASALREAA